jgi:hypothetical protein
MALWGISGEKRLSGAGAEKNAWLLQMILSNDR